MSLADNIEQKALRLLDRLLDDARDAVQGESVVEGRSKEHTSQDGEENFENWLPLGTNSQLAFSFTLSQQANIRQQSREIVQLSNPAQNVIKHYQNNIVGDGLTYELSRKDVGDDPEKLANTAVPEVVGQMLRNWERFVAVNKFDDRLSDAVVRCLRDGEWILRFFDQGKGAPPVVRIIDPLFIRPPINGATAKLSKFEMEYGIKAAPSDVEQVLGYWYSPDTNYNTPSQLIDAKDIIFLKRNTDYEFPRGLPDFYPTLAPLRRISKTRINTSVLVQIQSAIALVRKHKGASAADVAKLVSRQSDGHNRTDATTGRSVAAKKMRPGMIIDAPAGTEYDFPASKVKISEFVAGVAEQLVEVSNRHVIPVEWLLGKEPTNPLSPGSPVAKNFLKEQAWFFNNLVEPAFWRVQRAMGVPNVDKLQEEYSLIINGPRVAVGRAIDEARIAQILQQCGAMSSQTIAGMFGHKYAIERTNTIKHRLSLQPGEVAPGDLGNTNPGMNNGITSKRTGTKADNAPGGKESKKIVRSIDPTTGDEILTVTTEST